MDSGFFTVTTEHADFVNNLPILYYTHDPQTLFVFIPGVKIQDHYTGEVSCSISLPHYCSLLEKLSGPKSWPKQAAQAHSCLDQERVPVPLRLPGMRSVGMIVQNYHILSLLGPYTDQLGCRDKKGEAGRRTWEAWKCWAMWITEKQNINWPTTVTADTSWSCNV